MQNCGCDKHVKQATSVLPSGQRAAGLKSKDRQFQYQHVDFGCVFFFLTLGTLDLSEGKNPCFTLEIGIHMQEVD